RALLVATHHSSVPLRVVPTFLRFLLTIRRPPTSPLFPYTTLFRSLGKSAPAARPGSRGPGGALAGRRGTAGSGRWPPRRAHAPRSEEHTSELQSLTNIVCRLLLVKKKKKTIQLPPTARTLTRPSAT